MIPFLNIVLLSLDSEMISEDADLMSLDSDFTHYHFLMYINIAIGAIIFYYLYPWLRLFIDHYIIFRNREKIIIVGQSRMARTFAIDAASTGKKVTLITNKNQNNFSDELKGKGIKLMLVKEINEVKLRLAGINHASSCLVASDSDEHNISMSKFIGDFKRNKGGKKLKLIVGVQDWQARNLLIDQVNSFNSTPYVTIRFYDRCQSVARLIYDRFSPNRFVDDTTTKNNKKAICIVGYNEVSKNFLIENCILSQFQDGGKLNVFLLCKNATHLLEEFSNTFPALTEFISIYPVELHNTSFSSNYDWDKNFTDNIFNIDAVYVFGDDDASVITKSLNFRQFFYTHTQNIRKVPVIANLPESTSISSLLDEEGMDSQSSLFKKYQEELHIYFVKTFSDTCTFKNIIDDNEIESLAKVINYYYAIKHQFDQLLNDKFRKNNNTKIIKELEERMINFKIKKQHPYKQIESMVLESLGSYTKNSSFVLKQVFGIDEQWDSISERSKESNRYVARHLPSKLMILEKLGIKEINEETLLAHMDELAPLEHNRWSAEKIMAGFNYGKLPTNDKKLRAILKYTLKIHNQLKRYNLLDSVNKHKDIEIYLIIPLLIRVRDNL